MKRRDFVAAIAGLVPAAALLGSACATAPTPTVSSVPQDPGAWQQITTTLRLGLGETYKLTALYRGDRATAERYMYEQAERFVSEGAREVTFTGPVVVHGARTGPDVGYNVEVPVKAELMAIVGRLYPARTSTITFPSVPQGFYIDQLPDRQVYLVGFAEGSRHIRQSFGAGGAVLNGMDRREMVQRQADYMVMKIAARSRAACQALLRDHAWCKRYVFNGARADHIFHLALNMDAIPMAGL